MGPRPSRLAPDPGGGAPVRVEFDGACQPPRGGGIAGYGFVVIGSDLNHEDRGLAVPPHDARASNNVAEYVGAIRALEWLARQGYHGSVEVVGDSQLVIRQMNGQYQVRSPNLIAFHRLLREIERRFASVTYAWVPRQRNTRADRLSKLAVAEALAT